MKEINYGIGLKLIRKALDLNTDDFAKKCDITAGEVFKFEEDHDRVDRKEAKVVAQKICDALDVPLDVYAMLCIDRNHVKPDRLYVFDALYPHIIGLLLEIITLGGMESEGMPDKKPFIDAIQKLLDDDLLDRQTKEN